MKDFISKINQFTQKFSSPQTEKMAVEPEDRVHIPFTKLIFGPLGILSVRISELFKISAAFALLISLCTILLGFSGICFSPYRDSYFYCSNSQALYLLGLLLKVFLISMFFARWYNIAFRRANYSLKTVFLPTKRDVIFFGGLFIFLLLNLTPVLSFYLLYMRVPNPDWIVELAYFACVSVGFLVPFWLMRFYALGAAYLSEEKLPSLGYLWKRSKGNNLSIILSVFLIIVIMSFFALYYQQGLSSIDVEYANWSGTVLEYVYNLFLLMVLSLFVNHCWFQKKFLLGEDDGNNTAN